MEMKTKERVRLDREKALHQMEALGLGKVDVAGRSGYGYHYVWRALDGDWMSREAAEKVCRALEAPPEELIAEVREEPAVCGLRQFSGFKMVSAEKVMGKMLEKGWNFADLARATGLSRERVRQVAAPPRLDRENLRKLAEALGCREEEIVFKLEGGAEDADTELHAGADFHGAADRRDDGQTAGE